MRPVAAFLVAAVLASGAAIGQSPEGAPERSYHFSQAEVRQALKQLSAYKDSSLPMLEGFVAADASELERFSRAYYQFQISLKDAGGEVLVRPSAKITAWYSAPDDSRSNYRALPSNGRLERDLLDRLEDYLNKQGSSGSVSTAVLEDELSRVRSQREQVSSQRGNLERDIAEMEQALQANSAPAAEILVARRSSGAIVYFGPSVTSRPLLTAEPDDEFPVLEKRGGWVRVRLEPGATGWLQTSQTRSLGASEPAAVPAVGGQLTADSYSVYRDAVLPFLGEWKALQGKKALFLWVSSNPAIPTASAARQKLPFAVQALAEYYRQSVHGPTGLEFQGIVIVFPGAQGGVFAATTHDIQRWLGGTFSEEQFVAHCSIDPPSAFRVR